MYDRGVEQAAGLEITDEGGGGLAELESGQVLLAERAQIAGSLSAMLV